jgi:hypothetical protein
MNIKDRVQHSFLGDGKILRFSEDGTLATVRFKGRRDISFRTDDPTITWPVPSQPKVPSLVWIDSDGRETEVRQDFVEKLPVILDAYRGATKCLHREEVLAALGVDVQNTTKSEYSHMERQLRKAKAYIQTHTNIPICAVRSKDGGYFLAETRQEVLEEAELFRASAQGNIRQAEEIEGLAERAFPEETHATNV